MNQMLVDIGLRLRKRRKELGYTQSQVSEILNMSLNFYGVIERGKRRMSLEKIMLAYDKLGMDPTYLLTGKTPPQDNIKELLQDCPQDKIFDMEQLIRYASNLYR